MKKTALLFCALLFCLLVFAQYDQYGGATDAMDGDNEPFNSNGLWVIIIIILIVWFVKQLRSNKINK